MVPEGGDEMSETHEFALKTKDLIKRLAHEINRKRADILQETGALVQWVPDGEPTLEGDEYLVRGHFEPYETK